MIQKITCLACECPEGYRHCATLPDPLTLEGLVVYRAAVAVAMIRADQKAGFFHSTVGSYSDINEYADANMYLLDATHPIPLARSFFEWPELDIEEIMYFFDEVRDCIDDAFAEGVLLPAPTAGHDVMSITRRMCR